MEGSRQRKGKRAGGAAKSKPRPPATTSGDEPRRGRATKTSAAVGQRKKKKAQPSAPHPSVELLRGLDAVDPSDSNPLLATLSKVCTFAKRWLPVCICAQHPLLMPFCVCSTAARAQGVSARSERDSR